MKSRKCPQCGWKFPIAKVNAPISRINGKMFNCPTCHLPLICRTNHGWLYSVCTALIVPLAFFHEYIDVPIVREVAQYILLPAFTALSVIWRLGEYIELYES